MVKTVGRRKTKTDDPDADLKRVTQVGPAGALPTVMFLLALIAIFMFVIALLFKH